VNVSKSPLRRRATAIVAGSVLGLAGAVALAGPASAHKSTISGDAACVDATGAWKVTWKLNADGHSGTQYRLTQLDTDPANTKVGDWAVTPDKNFPFESNKDYFAVQTLGADVAKASVTVMAAWSNGAKDWQPSSATVTPPTNCKKDEPSTPPSSPSSPTPTPTTPENPVSEVPGEPEPIVEITCDTMTLGADNPADGIEFKMKFETSKGEVRETVVKPGEKKSETFSATTGFSVKWTISATIDGETESFTETISYTQPGDCDGEGDPDLPLTGAAAGGIAGGAGALLLVGAGLYLLARRRKVTFTA
jgi:LPXTG-motif cell wall-anchored protein